MLSGLFSRTKNKTKTILLVDLGSGSVGAALARLNAEGKPSLLYSTRAEIPIRLTRSGSELTEDILKAAETVIEDVRKEATLWVEGTAVTPQKIEQVAFFLAAPWSTTSFKSVAFSRNKPFVMNESLLERMLSEESKTMKASLEISTEVIERTAVSLKLNGYPAENIVPAAVTSAEVTLATTLAYSELCDALLKRIEALPTSPNCTFHSFAIPALHTIRCLHPEVSDALILDVRAEVTEAVLIRNGAPTARITAPSGTHVFQRTLRSHAHMKKAEADSALTLASKDGTRLSAELAASLEDATKLWLKSLSGALQSLSESAYPATIYLYSDERSAPWLLKGLTGIGLPAIYPAKPPQVQVLGPKELIRGVANVPANPDTFLLAELIYADSRFDEGHALSLLSTRDTFLSKPRATL